ncbi:MAG TPA: hypothetical protein VM124_00650 [Candidatus Limnocylindrales bacterium]|nr:hypothetical protein [Candidatus Limnocylindrales bacterium]
MFNNDPFRSPSGQEGLARTDAYPFAGQADVVTGDATLRRIFGDGQEVRAALELLLADSANELPWGTAIRTEPPDLSVPTEVRLAPTDISEWVDRVDPTDPAEELRLLGILSANIRAANAAPYPAELPVDDASKVLDAAVVPVAPVELYETTTQLVTVVEEPHLALPAAQPSATTYSLRGGDVTHHDPIDHHADIKAQQEEAPEVITPDAILTDSESIGKPFKLFRLLGGAVRFARRAPSAAAESQNPVTEAVVSTDSSRRFSKRRVAALALAATLISGSSLAYALSENSAPKENTEQLAPGSWIPQTVKFWHEKIEETLHDQVLADKLASLKEYPLVIDSQALEAIMTRMSGGDPHAEGGLFGINREIGLRYFGKAYDESNIDQPTLGGILYFNTRFVEAIQSGKFNNNRSGLIQAMIKGEGSKDGLELFPGDSKRTAKFAKDIAKIDGDWSKPTSSFFKGYVKDDATCTKLLAIYSSFREQDLVPRGTEPCPPPKEKS